MADGGFDPCECIWNHESAMRRLMNLLRQSQSYCTENECITDAPGPQSSPEGGMSMMMLAMIWMALALVLFLLRPNSMRRNRGDHKPNVDQGSGGNQQPPPPIQ